MASNSVGSSRGKPYLVMGVGFALATTLVPSLERPAPEPPTLTTRSLEVRDPAHDLALRREYAQAALAYRRGDREQARDSLSALGRKAPDQIPTIEALLGLQAYQEERWLEALQHLDRPPLAWDHELAEWQLLALAESAAHVADAGTSRRALEALLEGHPESPLRGLALETLARIYAGAGERDSALALLERAIATETGRGTRRELDVLTWTLARQTGDRSRERAAARRLLVTAPGLASTLGVLESMPPATGVGWEGVLSTEEVMARARSWLEEESPVSAEATLDTVRPSARGLEWSILRAEALTAQNRGGEAYLELLTVRATTPVDEARVEWQRALAAADLATAKKGREHRTSGERRDWLDRSREHLERVVALDPPADVSLQALRALYVHLSEEGRFDDSMEMLRYLRRIDPGDRTGASHLWELGWQQFRAENYTGAIGYWSQLEEIYPDDRETHRGRYWKARALEAVGQGTRAGQLYRDLVRTSDTADFYVLRARARLAGESPLQSPGSLSADWPEEPRLRRILALSDLGLDDLAARELDLVRDHAFASGPRDVEGLRGVLQVRRGQVRSGVQALRDAFPALGGSYQAAVPRSVLEAYYPFPFQDTIERHARDKRLEPALVAGMIRQESAFDPDAESWAGARGLMQLMPATAQEVSRKLGLSWEARLLFEPERSVELGTSYFRHVLDRFDGNVELALAGYNGGPNRIRRLWRQAGPDAELDHFLENLGISESQNYVKRILVLSDSYRQLY